jgi:hypothetical protein
VAIHCRERFCLYFAWLHICSRCRSHKSISPTYKDRCQHPPTCISIPHQCWVSSILNCHVLSGWTVLPLGFLWWIREGQSDTYSIAWRDPSLRRSSPWCPWEVLATLLGQCRCIQLFSLRSMIFRLILVEDRPSWWWWCLWIRHYRILDSDWPVRHHFRWRKVLETHPILQECC